MRIFYVIICMGILDACTPKVPLSPLAQRGHLIYQARCISCHNANPKKAGSLGPEIYGASLELLTSKIQDATYPMGYTPKRKTKVMPKQPLSSEDAKALFEYLNTKP